MTRLSRSLFGDLDVEVEMDAPIGVESWFCAGGRADFLVRPRTADALSEILKRSRQIDTPVRIMGEGANLLVDDDGVPGIVIRLDAPAFRAVEHNVEGRLELVRVGAGADLARTLMRFARAGTAGLESLMGVPASIGGAVRMNAGGAYGEIGDVVHAALVHHHQGFVPPDVVLEVVGLGPMGAQTLDPGQALVLAVLHLHDMGIGMGRPGVVGLQLDGLFRRRLGAGVLPEFLEPEGLHTLEVGIPRHVLGPIGQNTVH